MALGEKSKILIFGGTGYIGKFMVKASIFLGHPTYVYARPITPQTNPSKMDLDKDFQSVGVTIVQVISLSLSLSVCVSVRAAIIH